MADELRDELIRLKAFYIWLDEGCPEGRADVHWQMASDLIAKEDDHSSVHRDAANKRV